jgi:hypothetical protein
LSSSRRISSDRSNVNLRAVATYYSACVYSAVISCMVIMLYSSRTHRVYDKGGYNRKRCPLMIMNVAFMPAMTWKFKSLDQHTVVVVPTTKQKPGITPNGRDKIEHTRICILLYYSLLPPNGYLHVKSLRKYIRLVNDCLNPND